MRWFLLVAVLTAACGRHDPGGAERPLAEKKDTPLTPIGDPRFHDEQLQAIAANLQRKARARGITSVRSDGNAAERLIALEAQLGSPPAALSRVNQLILASSSVDATEWAVIRGAAQARCATRDDEACRRVTDLMQRWQVHKSKLITDQLETRMPYGYGGIEWERYFVEFIRKSPMDAATWGWMILHHREAEVRRQYGKANAERAYRYYLARTHLGKPREAQEVFSVPGIELD